MDTLTTSKILQEAGVATKHAEAIALLFSQNGNVATQDFVETKIASLELSVETRIASLELSVETRIASLEAKIDKVETSTKSFVETKIASLTNKMFITAISLTGVIITAIKIL